MVYTVGSNWHLVEKIMTNPRKAIKKARRTHDEKLINKAKHEAKEKDRKRKGKRWDDE
jgi:hypothetical protein